MITNRNQIGIEEGCNKAMTANACEAAIKYKYNLEGTGSSRMGVANPFDNMTDILISGFAVAKKIVE
jgi:hypothetical protein